jgi:hypothetical protein
VSAFHPSCHYRRPFADIRVGDVAIGVCRRVATATLLYLSVAFGVVGCSPIASRPDQENFVIDTSRVPVERFLNALSDRLSGSWIASDVTVPDADPSKIYRLDASDVTVILSAMPHDRCNPNAPRHTRFDEAYRLDFVYRTAAKTQREMAKQSLFQAVSDVGERMVKFEECPG